MEIGIEDEETPRELGALEAYARLRFHLGGMVHRNMLHGLAAALAGIDWRQLSPEHKAELGRQVEARMIPSPRTQKIDKK